MDRAAIKARLKAQRIEQPSWGFAATGTRFGKFPQPWAARSLDEKLQDAAQAQKLLGVVPTVALHIPWDKATDWKALGRRAADLGLAIGAINPNLFQDAEYQHGSFCHPDPAVRAKALAHVDECIAICEATGSRTLSFWFADGTNYPGQDDFRLRRRRMQECFAEVYRRSEALKIRLLIEYKFYEPAWYHTDLADWGASVLMCKRLGERAQVLVDTGHHALGTNIEWIVASLLDEGKLGGFHFNSRKYGDDDLTVGSINPQELFLIYSELVGAAEGDEATAKACANAVAYMFDQCHAYKNTVEAVIQSTCAVQEAYAKALSVDRAALAKARNACDVVGAEEILRDAMNSDVRPLLREVREEMGLAGDPLAAFRRSGYAERVIAQRGGAAAAGGGGF